MIVSWIFFLLLLASTIYGLVGTIWAEDELTRDCAGCWFAGSMLFLIGATLNLCSKLFG